MQLRGGMNVFTLQLQLNKCYKMFNVLNIVTGGANDRHSGCGVRPRRGFYSTEIIK